MFIRLTRLVKSSLHTLRSSGIGYFNALKAIHT